MEATKAIDDKEPGLDKPGGKKQVRKKLFLVRAAFLFTWLGFSFIIFIIAILTDINWLRPGLEQMMGQSIHRNVKLGKLSWHFGWQGFSVHTSRFLIAEKSGDPFLMASNCEIGFSLWPLLIGIGKIEYVDIQNPLFMAVRVDENKWNFNDLLVASPDIDSIQITDGHIFVVDREPALNYHRFPDTELNKVQIKLVRAGNFIPAQVKMSFDLGGADKRAQYTFESKTWGQNNKPWWEKKGHFELTTKRFTAENWQTVAALFAVNNKDLSFFNPFARLKTLIYQTNSSGSGSANIFLPPMGLFDFHAMVDGVPSNKMSGNLQLKVDNLLLRSRNNTSVTLPQTELAAQIELKPDAISWNKTVVKIPDYQVLFNSAGQLQNTADGSSQSYDWSIVGLLGDLKKLSSLASFVYCNMTSGTKDGDSQDLKNLNGKLFLDLHFNEAQNKPAYSIEAKAADVNIDGITPLLLAINRFTNNKVDPSATPFEKAYRQELDLSKKAIFSGTIIEKSDQGITLADCDLVDEQMSWKISGQANKDGLWNQLVISNKDLLLNQFSNKVNRDTLFGKKVKTFLGLRPDAHIELGGKAQIEAKISQPTENTEKVPNELICKTIFDDARLRISEPRLDIDHLNGIYEAGSQGLSCKNINFKIADTTTVDINANAPSAKKQPLEFHLHAKNIYVVDLQGVLQLFHLDTKIIDAWRLSGKLADIDLLIKGTPAKPVFTLVALPEDIVFSMPNTKQPLHALNGKLSYMNNIISLEKVSLSSQDSKCTISTIVNTNAPYKLEKLNLWIDNIDLADLQNYSNALSSNALFNYCSSLSKKFQINNLKGDIAGTVEYIYQKDKPHLNSVIQISGTSFKSGPQKLFCRNIKGKAIFTDNDLILPDVSGNIDDTSFNLHGKLANYKDKSAQWHGELITQVTPDHLNDLVSLFSSPGQKCSIGLQAKKAIFVKLKSHARNTISHQSFTISADPDAGLTITAGNFNFYQPNKKFTINGSCSFDDQKLTWRNLSFDFAGNSINVQGTVNNFRSVKDNTKPESTYDLQIQTSDYIPASYIGQIFPYGVINNTLTGQVKAVLSLQGPAKALLVSGKLFLSDLSIPELYLNHMIGTMSFQPATNSSVPLSLQLDKLNLADVQLSQASGSLVWQADDNSSRQSITDLSQIYLKGFMARISQGQLTADGYTDLKAKKAHLNMNVNDANLALLWPQLISYQIKAAGLLNAHFSFDTSGSAAKELEKNMIGSGKIHIGHGSFSKIEQLHARLNQVNLLHQGIFGFNVNNLMQSVLPTKATEFKSIDTAFSLDRDVLSIRHILYDGKDIKFSAAGKADLNSRSVDLDVAGVMPRVSNSVLGGKLGELSREITLQKLLDGMTMHKLDKLPSLPLLGGISGAPEIFTCRIMAPYDQPKLISQSIQKSFRWLHSH